MKGLRYFTPNAQTHPAFAEALKAAKKAGVQVLAFDCDVTPDTLTLGSAVPIKL